MRILPHNIPVVRGIRRTRAVPRRDMSSPEPKPCKHFFKRIPLNERFLKHLPTCEACRAKSVFNFSAIRVPENRLEVPAVPPCAITQPIRS
jgi:hypothetical protein